jgi:hypothetical protein
MSFAAMAKPAPRYGDLVPPFYETIFAFESKYYHARLAKTA